MLSSRRVRFIHFLLLYCTLHQSITLPLQASNISCLARNREEPTEDEEYGEFAELAKHFEDEIASQEESSESESIEKGIFSKWTKKLKRWFLDRSKKLFKKCLKLSHCQDFEECAYAAAKFKRKIDRVFKTGDIENILSEFDNNLPCGEKIMALEHFKDRIRFYYENKHIKPIKKIAKEKVRDDLKDIPFGAVIGGLEIFCGALIFILPLPGCKHIGSALAIDGGSRIATAMIEKHERDKQNNQKD